MAAGVGGDPRRGRSTGLACIDSVAGPFEGRAENSPRTDFDMLLERCRSRTPPRVRRGRAHEFRLRSAGLSESKWAPGTTDSKIDSWRTSGSASPKLMRQPVSGAAA